MGWGAVRCGGVRCGMREASEVEWNGGGMNENVGQVVETGNVVELGSFGI